MKNTIKVILQKLLGFDRYLYIFSIYIINTLKWNRKEGDFIFFRNMVPNGGLILDIGANIGVMSIHLARTHKDSNVIAFEPMPDNIKCLKKIIRHYGLNNISLIETALGERAGTIEMVMPTQGSARLQGLSHVIHESITDNNTGNRVVTPLTTLDDFFQQHPGSKPVTAIKIDVENYEYYVLKGAVSLLQRCKPIIYCELWENKNRDDCFSLLSTLGYEIRVLDKKHLSPYNPSIHKTQNFFFIPK
ncbi:MAG TPA: FkbM family methyltransferase [Bacteroidales bacterium]|nr:FkbM family methyltransferase [Bacteroidales bacterium]HNZ42322.1 FkbM family methyltransferase [Bacteroidales bacterium]HOH84062.1 FkbM family methyltransferase [Bacteroidales bacterium]HPB24838.1 FkbM family methyltransferase [Bacteroidales bacterium]HPI29710.1 FkbM family methyltransferase [Bacteroidales bacterium]